MPRARSGGAGTRLPFRRRLTLLERPRPSPHAARPASVLADAHGCWAPLRSVAPRRRSERGGQANVLLRAVGMVRVRYPTPRNSRPAFVPLALTGAGHHCGAPRRTTEAVRGIGDQSRSLRSAHAEVSTTAVTVALARFPRTTVEQSRSPGRYGAYNMVGPQCALLGLTRPSRAAPTCRDVPSFRARSPQAPGAPALRRCALNAPWCLPCACDPVTRRGHDPRTAPVTAYSQPCLTSSPGASGGQRYRCASAAGHAGPRSCTVRAMIWDAPRAGMGYSPSTTSINGKLGELFGSGRSHGKWSEFGVSSLSWRGNRDTHSAAVRRWSARRRGCAPLGPPPRGVADAHGRC